MFVSMDAKDGTIRKCNRTLMEKLGLSLDDLMGRPVHELYHPSAQGAAREAFALFLRVGSVQNVALTLKRRDGSTLPVILNATAVRDEGGNILYSRSIFRDVSKAREAEEKIRRTSEARQVIGDLLRHGLLPLPLEGHLRKALDLILSLSWLGLEPRGGIMLADDGQKTPRLIVQRGLPDSRQESCSSLNFGECLCGRAALERRVVFSAKVDGSHSISYEGLSPHGHYCVPILSSGRTLGVINLYLPENHLRNEDEEHFLAAVADTLAGIIERSRSDAHLREWKNRYEATIRATGNILYDWDSHTNYCLYGGALREILGYDFEEMEGNMERWMDRIHPDDRPRFEKAIHRLLDSKAQLSPLEFRMRRKDGGFVWIEGRGHFVENIHGEAVHMLGFLSDVTERRAIQERLILTAKVFENANEAIVVTDQANRIVDVNDAFTRITQYSREEALGNDPGFMKSGRHDRAFYSAMWKSLWESGRWEGEIWDRRKGGEVYPKWLTISTVKDEQGEITNCVGVFSDISQIKQAEEQLTQLAFYDPLTGLPNRVLFQERLEHDIITCRRNHEHLAVFFIDLDHFKKVNDTLGHAAGDRLLIIAGQRIQGALREMDTVTRMGGDEFTVIIRPVRGEKGLARVAAGVIEALCEPVDLGGHEVVIGASIGVAIFPEDGNDFATLTRNADAAMYRAKESGRNQFKFFEPAINQAAISRLTMENDLRKGLERGELRLYYQPLVDVASGRIIGMEALVRWQRDDGNLVAPDKFIPMAEEVGLIVPLGRWVLTTACRELASWRAMGMTGLTVSVNLSARQVREKAFLSTVLSVLKDTGLPPECLDLEVTESLIMENMDTAGDLLKELRRRGLHISLDDFGTGYSSLSYLKQLPIQTVKIDCSFIRDITVQGDDQAIVAAILSMARDLKLKVVAEGVESQAHLEFLRQRGCDAYQGYLFSPPRPAEDILQMVQRNHLEHGGEP